MLLLVRMIVTSRITDGNYNDAIYDEPIVKNGNVVEEGTRAMIKVALIRLPEAGDRFEHQETAAVTVDGEK